MNTIRAYHSGLATLPFADPIAMIGPGRALILAPHPDDESLGCGGLIATLCALGKPPLVVIMTDGAGSHPHTPTYPAERLIHRRRDEVRHATTLLGLPDANLIFLDHPDAALPSDGPALATITALIEHEHCTAVFAPDPHDPHCDHVATATLAKSATTSCASRLWHYPVWTWMRDPAEPIPPTTISGWRLDITAHISQKQTAIAAHRSQHGAIPDLPSGFTLPPALLARFTQTFEVFVAP